MEWFDKLAIFVVVAIAVGFSAALYNKHEECSSQGKVAVKAVFWYECVAR